MPLLEISTRTEPATTLPLPPGAALCIGILQPQLRKNPLVWFGWEQPTRGKTRGRKGKSHQCSHAQQRRRGASRCRAGSWHKKLSAPKRSRWGSGRRPHNKRQRCHRGGGGESNPNPAALAAALQRQGDSSGERKKEKSPGDGRRTAPKSGKGAVTKKGLIYKKSPGEDKAQRWGRGSALGKGVGVGCGAGGASVSPS